ncbi:MAG: hypothetical protein LBP67_05100 [Bacteroidales bacterium]|jgi:hypothetical protein|nr:hypothetical protein [Bacteroidales bacterium]
MKEEIFKKVFEYKNELFIITVTLNLEAERRLNGRVRHKVHVIREKPLYSQYFLYESSEFKERLDELEKMLMLFVDKSNEHTPQVYQDLEELGYEPINS